MRRLALLTLFLVLLAIPLARAGETVPPEKITIAQFGQERFLLYLPLYIAMEEGLFAKHGLDVTLKFAGNDDQIFAAVMSGDADFGMGDPVFAAIASEKGFPGKVVAMMITKLGLSGVAKDPAVPMIADIAQLNGLRVSSFPSPSTTFTLFTELRREHRLDNLKIVEAPFGGQIALLEAGEVDIANDIEPSVSIAESKGYRVVLSLSPFTPQQAVTGIMATGETLEKRPETVQKVVSALQEAMNLLYSDPEASIRTGKAIYPNLEEAVIRAAVTRMRSDAMYPRSIAVADDLWQRTLKTRLDAGDLYAPQDTAAVVDNRFAEEAAKAVGVTAP